MSIKIAREYERGVIFRLGRLIRLRGPGLFFIIPLKDLGGYSVCATDGDIGTATDFLLGDQHWNILYLRVDWQWAQSGGVTLCHGWKPESGFLHHRWEGYDEALLLYVLARGSPSHPVSRAAYDAWASTYQWKRHYDVEYLYAGPLFTHQLSHVWIDFRGIRDAFMRAKGVDYFENSRRATQVHRLYAIDNPLDFAGYGRDMWRITASDGPGPVVLRVDGVERRFYDYEGRGAPDGLDDGTLAPWAVVASLPFAPESRGTSESTSGRSC